MTAEIILMFLLKVFAIVGVLCLILSAIAITAWIICSIIECLRER